MALEIEAKIISSLGQRFFSFVGCTFSSKSLSFYFAFVLCFSKSKEQQYVVQSKDIFYSILFVFPVDHLFNQMNHMQLSINQSNFICSGPKQ